MNKNFAVLLHKLEAREITPMEFHAEAKTIEDFSTDLYTALKNRLETGSPFVLTNLIWLIHLFPSAQFSDLLCQLLTQRQNSSYMEAIVDALHAIKDPNTVTCLKSVLTYREAGDDDCSFARKVLWALENIRNEEARQAIVVATKDSDESIRETATQILKSWV